VEDSCWVAAGAPMGALRDVLYLNLLFLPDRMAGKRSYAQGGFNKARTLSSGRVLKYRKSAGPAGPTRTARRFAKAKARLGLSQAAVSNLRIGGFMGIELKFKDTSVVDKVITAPTDAAGAEMDPTTVNCLNPIAQGDGESERDGRQCVMKSCYVTGIISEPVAPDQADALAGGVYYVALVQDTQTNAAQLNSEDVFINPGAAAKTAPLVLRDMQYTARFRVLDSVILMEPNRFAITDGTNTGSISGFHLPFKLSWNGDMPCTFIGTTANVSSIQDNSLHIIAYCSTTSGVPVLSYNSRVRFVG